ncbi:CMRF35-like molecule 7 [Alosa pseudoharengus]|uniref:CMRF35-like molecule 7 n=1 Tax=Alosa pseudoharengus TaxID=34774 RepID=UPI003F895A09
MKTSIKITLLTLTVLSCVSCKEITVRGHEGGNGIINCTYQKGYESYIKYLWKGEFKDGVDVIRSNGWAEWTYRGRVSLQDKKNEKDRGIFTVTIRNLTLEDAGTYGCGVDRWLEDLYTIVKLIVGGKWGREE